MVNGTAQIARASQTLGPGQLLLCSRWSGRLRSGKLRLHGERATAEAEHHQTAGQDDDQGDSARDGVSRTRPVEQPQKPADPLADSCADQAADRIERLVEPASAL